MSIDTTYSLFERIEGEFSSAGIAFGHWCWSTRSQKIWLKLMVLDNGGAAMEKPSKRKRDRRLAQLPYLPTDTILGTQALLLHQLAAESRKMFRSCANTTSPVVTEEAPMELDNLAAKCPFLAAASRKRKRQVDSGKGIRCLKCGQVSKLQDFFSILLAVDHCAIRGVLF